MVKDGTFREISITASLLSRLNFRLYVKRTEDIPGLAQHFIEKFCCGHGTRAVNKRECRAFVGGLHLAWQRP